MGFFKFLDISSSSQSTDRDVTMDLTIKYPPRKRPARSPRVPVPMPMEIVLSILEAAYYDDDLKPNKSLLKDCALVCKDWSASAQKLLFRDVSLTTQTAYIAFQAAVDRTTKHGRTLSDAVLRMRVILDHNQPYRLADHSFARAVSLCPNLYELDISLYGWGPDGKDVVGNPQSERMRRLAPSFNKKVLALLESGPRITALKFSNWSENRHSLKQLLDVWPTLKSLVIRGTAPQLPAVSSEPAACKLSEIQINCQSSPSVDFLKWLLHNSSDTLRAVELEREPCSDVLDFFATAHGETLESLSIPTCAAHDHAVAVQRFSYLKELRTEAAWAASMAYRKLPRGIQHVALGLDGSTALQPVIEVVKTRDELRAVTVQVWEGGEEHPQLAALKMACAYRGVELRFTKDVKMFRAMIRGDPVPWTSFPRVKSFDNLQLMRRGP